MKKTVTEYEPAEDTTRLIQCDNCTTTWESRDTDSVEPIPVVHNLGLQRKSYSSGWRDRMMTKGRYIHSTKTYRMVGDGSVDLCHDCWSSNLDASMKMEVERPEYYVEETTHDEYYCDFCDDHIGRDESDTVTVNPRVKAKLDNSPAVVRGENDPDEDVVARTLYKTFKPHSGAYTHTYITWDEQYDACGACIEEIFYPNGRNSKDTNEVHSLVQCVCDFCASVKNVLLWRNRKI